MLVILIYRQLTAQAGLLLVCLFIFALLFFSPFFFLRQSTSLSKEEGKAIWWATWRNGEWLNAFHLQRLWVVFWSFSEFLLYLLRINEEGEPSHFMDWLRFVREELSFYRFVAFYFITNYTSWMWTLLWGFSLCFWHHYITEIHLGLFCSAFCIQGNWF